MPTKLIAEVKDWNKYKKVLKADMNLALVKAQPFRFYEKFKFDGGKTGPLLVVGPWDKTLLESLQENAAARKTAGKLALQGRESLEFQLTTGTAKIAEIQTALNFSGVTGITPVEVEKLSADKRDEAEAVVTAAKGKVDEQAAIDIQAKKESLRVRGQAVWAQLTAEERKTLETASKGIAAALTGEKLDAYTSIADAERMLAAAEQRLGKDVGSDGSAGPAKAVKDAYAEYATTEEARTQTLDDAIKTAPPTAKKLDDSAKLGDGTVKSVKDELAAKMGARVEGQKWQADEIKAVKEATAKLERQAELVGEVLAKESAKKNAKKEVDDLVKFIDKTTKEIAGLDEGAEKERKTKQLAGAGKELPEAKSQLVDAEQQLKAANDEKVAVDKWVEDNDAEKIAGKHGSGRHGAQTGIEGQARRVATGGYGADQPGNESGTSRPMVDPSGTAIGKIQWNKVNIEWETVLGKRTIKNREKVLKEIVIQAETHFQETIASSLFLGPEFEKEAVTRALAIVKDQCKWSEINEGPGWTPLKRVMVTLGKPSKGAGWGTGVEKRAGAQKKTMLEANKILEDFRNGKIDQNKILEQLGSQLATKPDGGGVALVPTCLVILDRTAPNKPWINITQYPCNGATAGWNLQGKPVRVDSTAAEETAPACTGV